MESFELIQAREMVKSPHCAERDKIAQAPCEASRPLVSGGVTTIATVEV